MSLTNYRLCIIITALASSLSLWVSGFPTGAQAQLTPAERVPASGTPGGVLVAESLGFKAPARGLPGRREGAGTRGPVTVCKQPLMALMPETNLGQTLSPYPSFFFYIPATAPQTVQFELVGENEELVYKTTFKTTGKTGVVSISLPDKAGLPPLEVGKDYRWEFSISCNADIPEDDQLVEGWVQRVEPNPALVRDLQKASVRERVALYASAGLWHETLSALASARRAEPGNSALAADWASLLQSVGLNKIAQEPLLD
jgi:hypothetical protein